MDVGEIAARNSNTLWKMHDDLYRSGAYRIPFNQFIPNQNDTKIRPGSRGVKLPAQPYNSIVPLDFGFKEFPKAENLGVTLTYSQGLDVAASAW